MTSPPSPVAPVDRAPDKRWEAALRATAMVCIGFVVVASPVVLVGSVLGIPWLAQGPGVEGIRPIPPATAVLVMTVGLAVWLSVPGHRAWAVRLGRVLLAIAMTVVVVMLGLIAVLMGRIGSVVPSSQVPASSALAILGAIAVGAWLQSADDRQRQAAGQVLSGLAGTIALVPLLGYVLGDRNLFGFPFGFGEIAFPTVVLGLILAVGTLVGRPGGGALDVAISNSPGGLVLRRLALPVLLIPPVILFAFAAGESNRARVLAWIGTAIAAVGLSALVFTSRALDRLDVERRRAEVRATAAEEGLRQEVALAARLREAQSMVGELPQQLSIGVRYVPAEGVVGGDAHAVVAIDDQTVGMLIIDIASHGVEPAIAAVRMRDVVTSSLIAGLSPSRALESVCWLVREAEIMATGFVAALHLASETLTHASAGHVPVLLRALDELHSLGPTGPLLHPNVVPGWEENVHKFPLGATLIAYSDGIADVVTRRQGATTLEWFRDLMVSAPDVGADELADWCIERLELSSEWSLADDFTLLAVGSGD